MPDTVDVTLCPSGSGELEIHWALPAGGPNRPRCRFARSGGGSSGNKAAALAAAVAAAAARAAGAATAAGAGAAAEAAEAAALGAFGDTTPSLLSTRNKTFWSEASRAITFKNCGDFGLG